MIGFCTTRDGAMTSAREAVQGFGYGARLSSASGASTHLSASGVSSACNALASEERATLATTEAGST